MQTNTTNSEKKSSADWVLGIIVGLALVVLLPIFLMNSTNADESTNDASVAVPNEIVAEEFVSEDEAIIADNEVEAEQEIPVGTTSEETENEQPVASKNPPAGGEEPFVAIYALGIFDKSTDAPSSESIPENNQEAITAEVEEEPFVATEALGIADDNTETDTIDENADSDVIEEPVEIVTEEPEAVVENTTVEEPADTTEAAPLEDTSDESAVEATGNVVDITLNAFSGGDPAMAFEGVGGAIDGVVNPSILVNVGDTVRITLINQDVMQHNLTIDEYNVATTELVTLGQEDTIEFVVTEPGTITYYCSVPGHQTLGMEGTILALAPAS